MASYAQQHPVTIDGNAFSRRLGCAAFAFWMLLPAFGWAAGGQSSGKRIQALLRRMSLDEKISLVHGTRDPAELGQAGYWPGLPRLGIPPLRFADGPPGVNVNRDATGMPAPVGLAATFDTEAARLYGVVLGRDAKALQQDVMLAPHVNIVRDPIFRRNHTTFSEDPFLSARLTVAQIGGIQSQSVMAQVKHLAGYNGPENVFIDERTLHEMYFPAFEAAVRAGVASVMCAYNKLNGAGSCDNDDLQNSVLRGQWGFKGFVTSDWGAVHGPLAITRGLDLEMPGREIAGRRGGPYFREDLKSAVESGAIPVSAVDRAVSRILEQMDRFGLLSRKSSARPRTIDVEADARVVREIAQESAVLLKNDGDALPLASADLESLALIGPTAGQLAAGFMGERAYGFEPRLVSPLTALRKIAPAAKIEYWVGVDLAGVPVPGMALAHKGRPGLLRSQADSSETRLDTVLDFQGASALDPQAEYSWTGVLTIPSEGDYTFMVQPVLNGGSEGGGTVQIDGQAVARTGGPGFGGTGMVARKWSSLLPTADGRDSGRGTVRLAVGAHRIDLTAHSTGEDRLNLRFSWITPEFRRSGIEAAARLAGSVRTAVVFAWSGTGNTLSLPENQDELIEKVVAANPRTVVVLNTGGPVAMPWKDRVRAILEMWYPGQEGGWATANLLLGRANPSGRLPVTFPMRLEDAPDRAAGHPERFAPNPPPGTSGINSGAPAVTFSEGTAIGYRWYDQQNIDPLFPFGHGLSYTRFEYSSLVLQRTAQGLNVSFTVRNTGAVKGAEVPQVYIGPLDRPPVRMALKSLVGIQRLELEPGRSRRIAIYIDSVGLSYWSIEKHGWTVADGDRPVYVGSSSRDIRLEGKIRRTSPPVTKVTTTLPVKGIQ